MYIGEMYIAKLWCACLHATNIWEYGRCSFWKNPHSNHNSSKQIANKPGGHTSHEFCVTHTKNLVLILSKEITIWVFVFDCASCNVFAATLDYTCLTIVMTSPSLPLSW